MKDLLTSKDKQAIDTGTICLYDICSSNRSADLSFNLLNCSYPYWHRHDHWELLLITKGKIIHSINKEQMEMQEGDICLICPNDCHRIDTEEENATCSHISFLIKDNYINEVFNCYGKKTIKSFLDRSHVARYRINEKDLQDIINTALGLKAKKEITEELVFQTKIIVNKLINFILHKQFEVKEKVSDWLSNFLNYLNNPYLNPDSIKDMATRTPYSYYRLVHVFKEQTGRTIIEYITTVKMEHAKEMLSSTNYSIISIASSMGYYSISNFNSLFKKHTNMTPSEYRKSTKPIEK